jgi:ATP-dependent helicase HrpA
MPPNPGPTDLLPILARRAEIEDAIRRHRVVVICGETGSGKTTQLPQICLALANPTARGIIAHTQPRRLAARAVAARIAEELNTPLGELVGVKVRFQDQTGPRTKIKLLTDGMLLAELGSDPELRRYSTIIIDEAHERSLNIDFLLGYLRHLVAPGGPRPDLTLIITSATIDPKRFSDHFGGPSIAPVIEVSGRTYPVEIRYRPTQDDPRPPSTSSAAATSTAAIDVAFDISTLDFSAIADAVDELCSPRLPEGDVLVFLPGEREIRLATDALRRRSAADDADILPLFSRLSNQEQDRIFHPGGRRRVILATNVAETSLTVPGIRYVVDTGLARLSRYDPARKIQKLPVEWISRASAQQRSGRCGRVAAGVCIRLYSESAFTSRPMFTAPEIRRTNLAGVILQMKSLGLGPIEHFPFLDPPDAAQIRDGYETLFELGALDTTTSDPATCAAAPLSRVGIAMSRIPLDPRLSRILIAAAEEDCVDDAVILAAALAIQDPRERPMGKQDDADRAQLVFRNETSDFLTLRNIWDQHEHATATMSRGDSFAWCREHFISATRMREWADMVRQLRDVAADTDQSNIIIRNNKQRPPEDRLHRALLTGLISNVACREGESGSFDYRGVRGNVVQIFPGSALFKKGPKWIMAAEVVQTTRLFARTVARIDPEWIEELAGHMFRRQFSDHHLDAETGEPSAWERVTMSGIVVVPRRRASIAAHDPAAARQIFLRDALGAAAWQTDEPFQTRNRVVLAAARSLEAKLRRRGVVRSTDELAEWFARRVPAAVVSPGGLMSWLRGDAAGRDAMLMLGVRDVVKPEFAELADSLAFPDELAAPAGVGFEHPALIEYVFSPGKEADGITVTVRVADLPNLTPERCAWLVPGMLAELVLALIKSLPKQARSALERKGAIGEIAQACAGLMDFAARPLPEALSEAVEVLHGAEIAAEDWPLAALPAHLRMRVRVVDDHGKELAADRDLAALMKRFEAKIKAARAAKARATFERDGLVAWEFGDLPGRIEVEHAGVMHEAFPAIIDRGGSVSLSLAATAREAEVLTRAGVRRLFALACGEELKFHLEAFSQWSEMCRQFGQLGTATELRDAMTCIVAERTFMSGQAGVTTRGQFEERREQQWGRLAASAREAADVVARILEPRSIVAKRLSGGTPRIWASSTADIREHAAYLMPRGFLTSVSWERLREYPRYSQAMRERLLALREDGKQAETAALEKFLPQWKRFTGWVAQAMSAERAAAQAAELEIERRAEGAGASRLPLPRARRAAPSVNVDAGEWALMPGALPANVERYRWALEDVRVLMFAPGSKVAGWAGAIAEVEKLWAACGVR